MVQSAKMKNRRRIQRVAIVLLVMLVLLALQTRSDLPPADTEARARSQTTDVEYAFGEWILNALRVKVYNYALGANMFMTDEARRKLVEDYLQLIKDIL